MKLEEITGGQKWLCKFWKTEYVEWNVDMGSKNDTVWDFTHYVETDDPVIYKHAYGCPSNRLNTAWYSRHHQSEC